MKTVEQALRAMLQQQTASGILGPGGKLPTERDLAGQLAAPRSEIRRALSLLEQDGLITRHVGRGTFLTELVGHQFDGAPPDTSPAEIMQTRLLIEPPVAMLAARLATQADLDRIISCLEAGGRSDGYEEFERRDAQLHRAIAQSVRNQLLMSMFDVMSTARELPVWGSLKRRTSSPERRRDYHEQHTRVVTALTERDPAEAEAAMRAHLRDVSDNMLGQH
jgi:DNA-binding FadR family transcriptional regulator